MGESQEAGVMKKKAPALVAVNSDRLKRLLKKEPQLDGDIDLRLHRAISWLKSAEQSSEDLRFISLWIAFNACYAIDDLNELAEERASEKSNIRDFLKNLEAKDEGGQLGKLLWDRFSNEIRILLNNKYIFQPYWNHLRGIETEYETALQSSLNKASRFMSEGRVADLLYEVLTRLYVLRNQLFHGGATFQGKVNRSQVKDGAAMLEKLVPVIIEIMIQNKQEDWGKASFPPVEE